MTKIAEKAAPAAAAMDKCSYDFEKGDVQGWIPRGAGVSVSSVNEAAQSGSYSLKATGRSEA